ncbi:MAG: cell envelope integrity protein TolA, partial [Steroidobacteraceae bacterium]
MAEGSDGHMQQLERRSDRWVSTAMSVLLHGGIVAALVVGWWSFRHETRPTPTLAIDATVVGPQALKGATEPQAAKPKPAAKRTPPPTPQPALQAVPQPALPATTGPLPPDDQTVPAPPPPDLAKRAAERAAALAEQQAAQAAAKRKAQAQAQAQQATKRAAEQASAAKAAHAAAARTKRVAEEKAAEHTKQLARAAAAAKAAKAKKLAEAKAVAEAKARRLAAAKAAAAARKKALAEKLAEARRKAQAEHRAAVAKALALNPTNLAQNIAAEENTMAARSGPAMQTWVQEIQAKITQNWNRPPAAKTGLDCTLDVTQVPGGQIVNVTVGACNGDAAVVQSIKNAAYQASPLPPPPDPALFERDLQ